MSAIPDFANLVQWTVRAAIACALLAASACPGSEQADLDGASPGTVTTSPSLVDPDGGRLVDRECDTAPSLPPVECWWLEVPERRDDPHARTIRLWVLVVHQQGPDASLPPVIDVTGGPGDTASTAWVDGRIVLDGGDSRTIVVMDQRGTGRSEPRLGCDLAPGSRPGVSWDDRLEGHRALVASCRAELVAEGVDLDGYNTVESAADFVDLRRALGVEGFLLRGLSYGGRLAREIYRQDPDGVAGLLLDSPLTTSPRGPADLLASADDALARLDEACAADADCRVHGSVSENLRRAAAQLDDQPYETAHQLVDGAALYSGVHAAMYRSDLLPVIPAAAAALARGEWAVLDVVADELVPVHPDPRDAPADGLHEIVTCAEDGPSHTAADRRALVQPGRWADLVLPHASCDLWDVRPVDGRRLRPAVGDLPVLVMFGELDPITPPRFAQDVLASFPDATSLVLPGQGHGVAWGTECTRSISLAFTASPGAPLDTTCTSDLPGASPSGEEGAASVLDVGQGVGTGSLFVNDPEVLLRMTTR